MIPGTLLGLVALAAALGPGYLYVRRSERHHNRPIQSQLGELVEMVVIGGAASLLAVGLVLGVAHSCGFLNTAALHKDATGYLLSEPWRCFAAASVFYALAYGIGFSASWWMNRDSEAAIVPGATGWSQAMRLGLPVGKQAVRIVVELSDGRRIAGVLRSFNPAERENREIVLVAPLVASSGPGRKVIELNDDFVVLREEQFILLGGRYIAGAQ